MQLHFCGNLFHDIPIFIIMVIMMVPGIKVAGDWVRAKIYKRKQNLGCCDCHKE